MIKEFSYKRFGNISFSKESLDEDFWNSIENDIKILFFPRGSIVQVDFQEFMLDVDSLLFVNPKVVIKPCEAIEATLMHFNRDFYCIEIHDHEVACDGILYNNVFEIPFISLNDSQSQEIKNIINEIKNEMKSEDSSTEEMLRILLKLIILKSTRIWKKQHYLENDDLQTEVNFLRKFSLLVEQHYKTHHKVSDYADMLFMTPKNLGKKISLISKKTPNDIIKDRLILESKRLLFYTSMSVKEIAYNLNYDDDAYFVRFFTKNAGLSPASFRKNSKI